MLKAKKMTARQIVIRYAKMHGLYAHGSDRQELVIVADNDKRGHEREIWRLPMCESWAEAHALLKAIEDRYIETLEPRPWETARRNYTGQMKPLPSSQEIIA